MPRVGTVKYSLDDRQAAEDAFIFQGCTLEQISAGTGISMATLKRWSADDAWVQRQHEHQQSSRELGQKLLKIKNRLADHILSDPAQTKAVYALARLLELDGTPQKTSDAEARAGQPARVMTEEEARELVRQEYGIN